MDFKNKLGTVDAHNLNFRSDNTDSHNIILNFEHLSNSSTILNFGDSVSSSQYISTTGDIFSNFGGSSFRNDIESIYAVGIYLFDAYGFPRITQSKFINVVNGISLSRYGYPSLSNFNKNLYPIGFNASVFGSNRIYNSNQHIRSNGFAISVFGNTYLQGGVKYIATRGTKLSQYGLVSVINNRADQRITLTANQAILPITVPQPSVSPRTITAYGNAFTLLGAPTIYLRTRFITVAGYVTTSYGIAWASHNPRYLVQQSVGSFLIGFPKVFDPAQKVNVTGVNTVIAGGVFGDVSIRNTRRRIDAGGLYSQSFSDWATVQNTRRAIEVRGFYSEIVGLSNIHNKTPSLAPVGISAFNGLSNVSTGYRIRNIKPIGLYQPKFGLHVLTKTPEIKPSGFSPSVIGGAWVSNKNRAINAGLGRESLAIGNITIWHYSRFIRANGSAFNAHGTQWLSHGKRILLQKGSIHHGYGNAWVSYAVRTLTPTAIVYPNVPIHRVGGTQYINLSGYVASLFGSRIIPEAHQVYPQGFINSFGLSDISLWKRHLRPSGFLTTGQEGGHRFGTGRLWNLRQYIAMFYDVDSELTPPKWVGWTAIENRNKTIGTVGRNNAMISEPYIENKARLITVNGSIFSTFTRPMVAERVRYIRLQGMEQPYISGWSNVSNDADVVKPISIASQIIGRHTVENTRRYFPRIGNFDSMAIGLPMISYCIRRLTFEPRYTIAPIYIPIHRVDLHTRYIEEVGRFDDHQAFGNAALSIHWNIITPRWTLRDAYGTPAVKNLTPELGVRGRNSEDFGQASIRTQWRELLHLGSETAVWGRSEIAFRDRQFSVSGFTQWAIPKHTVIKTGIPPYYPQYIWLDAVEIDGDQKNGYGIEPPPTLKDQVSRPGVKSNVIFPYSFIASRYGSHHAQSNGILVQPGLQELTIGNPFVWLKNRNITVPSLGDSMIVSKPRLSPHTIYAVIEASSQAKKNHPVSGLHYVNSSGGAREPGEVFGRTIITLRHRKLSIGLGNQSSFGNAHKIQLRKRYIHLKDFGFRSQRIGFHVVGPFDQDVMQFDSNNMQSFGQSLFSILYRGPLFIKPNGFTSPTLNRPRVDFFIRTVKAVGSNHLQMGAWRGGDTPFMWQGLRIGELIKGNYGGFENELFGNTFISLKVRNVEAQGFESFVMEYDYTQFDQRMRVVRQELPKPKLLIKPVGVAALLLAVPNIKPAVHYIRPDGNADQFRKGAF